MTQYEYLRMAKLTLNGARSNHRYIVCRRIGGAGPFVFWRSVNIEGMRFSDPALGEPVMDETLFDFDHYAIVVASAREDGRHAVVYGDHPTVRALHAYGSDYNKHDRINGRRGYIFARLAEIVPTDTEPMRMPLVDAVFREFNLRLPLGMTPPDDSMIVM